MSNQVSKQAVEFKLNQLATRTVDNPQVFNGTVKMPALPTSDPSVAGQLWSNAGVLTVSAG
jgi:hypothetical protein